MKVAIIYPTVEAVIERWASIFPQGVDVIGPDGNFPGMLDSVRRRVEQWAEVGLKITVREMPYDRMDLSGYDLALETAETFLYAPTWLEHCLKVQCPILLKACWMRKVSDVPAEYAESRKPWPLILETPAFLPGWTNIGFNDVTVIPQPAGDWWFTTPWTGKNERVLFVLNGKDSWRQGPKENLGIDWWERICKQFSGKCYHHDGCVRSFTPKQMAEMEADCRVFVNFDTPFGAGERPLSVAFSEAVCAGLPVVARNLDRLYYRDYIDGNGACVDRYEAAADFIARCLGDWEFARACSVRSREIGKAKLSVAALRPSYLAAAERAQAIWRERGGQ